jgi:hypothetical protein
VLLADALISRRRRGPELSARERRGLLASARDAARVRRQRT